VNAVGLQNNVKNLIWFDGGSTAVSSEGKIIWRMPQHEESLGYLNGMIYDEPRALLSGVAEYHAPLIAAMKQFYAPFAKVVIGLSGGIDSAVQLALLVEAIGADKVLTINMPTRYNSNTTQDLARVCAENFGVDYRVVPIQGLYESHLEMLKAAGYENLPSLVLENIQARIRSASVLAAIAQTEHGVFTCNGNKTEMALNYFTLYGDGAGVSAFLADLWKGQIYDLAWFINDRAGRELIPSGIIHIIPSAELSSEQNVDEGKGDPIFYPYHDNLLRAFTELRWTPATVMQHLVEGNLEEKLNCASGTLMKYFKTRKQIVDNLEWAWERYNVEWKRAQTPPVFIASRRAFGFDRRDTIAPSHTSLEYERLVYLYLHAEDGNCRIGI
jgi:NAD+ synthase (glutamine-hydrolysing)